MKLKEVSPNDGDVFTVGAGTVTYIDGWWVGSQRITDDMFEIIGELEVSLAVPDKNGDPIIVGRSYTVNCTVISIDSDDEKLNAKIMFQNPGRESSAWINSELLSPNEA